jgi:hypothetical protein
MKAILSVTSALLLGLSFGCANGDDEDDDVPGRTQSPNPSTAGGAQDAGNSIAECVDACLKDAADCATACTGGGNCSATCDSTFASCERECEQIGR